MGMERGKEAGWGGVDSRGRMEFMPQGGDWRIKKNWGSRSSHCGTASWEPWDTDSIPGRAQWVNGPALPQLRLRSQLRLGSHPWLENATCHGTAKKEKKKKKKEGIKTGVQCSSQRSMTPRDLVGPGHPGTEKPFF